MKVIVKERIYKNSGGYIFTFSLYKKEERHYWYFTVRDRNGELVNQIFFNYHMFDTMSQFYMYMARKKDMLWGNLILQDKVPPEPFLSEGDMEL